MKEKDFSNDIHQRQRNTVYPDTLRNARSVDSFLWHGSADATMVQRIGAFIFGVVFIPAGAAFPIMLVDVWMKENPSWFGVFFSAVLIALSLAFEYAAFRMIRNAFRRS